MDEFGLIKKYFAPLASGFAGSLDLTDDAALIDIPNDRELVVTTDAIIEGVHFLGSENAGFIAKKLLRVNLSDLAAMGAQPLCYFLSIMLPKRIDDHWLSHFTQGLAEDQKEFGIALAGGDTTATNGPMTFSVTALGTVEKSKALKRSGAKAGDDIYVSGTIGDSALGLKIIQHSIHVPLSLHDDAFLAQRYHVPQPRITLGQKLSGLATSGIDISDGLVQDLDHICRASHVGAHIHRHLIPISSAAHQLVIKDAHLWAHVLGGGDDYELLFTAPSTAAADIEKISGETKTQITRIGSIGAGTHTQLFDKMGNEIPLTKKGYRHF